MIHCKKHPNYDPVLLGEPDPSCLRCWQTYARHCHQQRLSFEKSIKRLQERIAELEAPGSGLIN